MTTEFRLVVDGKTHTIREFSNGKAVCEREDGKIVYLHGWEKPETWEPRRSFFQWFNPMNI